MLGKCLALSLLYDLARIIVAEQGVLEFWALSIGAIGLAVDDTKGVFP